MSSKPVEPQGEHTHQQQIQNNPGSRRSRYELRTPRNNQIEINVSKKRKSADHELPRRADKRRRVGAHPCDQRLDATGGVQEKLKGANPCDQRLDATGGVQEKQKGAEPCCQKLPSDADGLREVRIKESDFFSVINRRIEVYWPLDGTWYVGNIKRYDAYNKLHHVVYDDGEEEWVSLERDRYRIQVVPSEFLRVSSNSRKRNVHGNAGNRGIVRKKHGSGGTDILQKRSGVDVVDVPNVVQRTNTDVVQKDSIDDGADVVQKDVVSGDTDVLHRNVSGGDSDIVQRSANGGLQKGHDSRSKGLKNGSKQAKNVGIIDLEKDYDGGVVGFDSAIKRQGRVKRYDLSKKLQLVAHDNGEEEGVPLESDKFGLNAVLRNISGVLSSGTKSSVCGSAEDTAIGQSKHGGTEILEETENGSLHEKENGRRKRRKRGSKQVANDVQMNFDAGVGVPYASALQDSVSEHKLKINVETNRVSGVFGDSDIHSGSEQVKSAGSDDLQEDCGGGGVGVDFAKVFLDSTCKHKLKSKSEKLGLIDHSGISSDSKQLKYAGIDYLQRDCDGSVGVDSVNALLDSDQERETQSKFDQISFAGDFDNSRINDRADDSVRTTDDQMGSTSMPPCRKSPAITYSRKRHHSKRGRISIQDRYGKNGNGAFISGRTETKGKNVEDEIGAFSGLDNDSAMQKQSIDKTGTFSGLCNDSAVEKHPIDKIDTSSGLGNYSAVEKHPIDKIDTSSGLGNDSVLQKQLVNAYFRKRKRSQPDNESTMYQIKGSSKSLQSFEQLFMFPPKSLIVFEVLNIHVSPLHLRQPSYCQCVAPGLQLRNRGSSRAHFELVESKSLDDLMLLLQSMLQFCCAGAQQSCSSHSALQQFGAGIVNPSNLKYSSLWEFLTLMTSLSDIQMQVMIVDTMSNVRRFYISGSFWEVLSNFIMSLVPVIGTGPPRSANLHMAFQSITVQISSLQGGLPFTCKFDNIHWTLSAKQAEWWLSLKGQLPSLGKLIKGGSSGGGLANHGGPPLLPNQSVFKYEQDGDIINVLKESADTPYFTSHHQHSSRAPLHHTRNDFGTLHAIPSFRMNFTSAPSFFVCLHMMLSFSRGICLDCSQSYELESSNVDSDLDSSAATGIVECDKNSLPGLLPNTEEPAILSRASQSSILVPSNVLHCLPEKHVKLEENVFAIADNWRVQSSAPYLGFDSNVTGSFSDIHVKRDNLLPVLKIRRTDNNSWHFAGVLNPYSIEGGTSRVLLPRVVGTNGHIESSQSAGSRSTSENANDVVLRSARSGRRGRPRRQSHQEKLKETRVRFSKLRSELDSMVCTANIMVFGRDRYWREPGAEVGLVHKPNEWVLDVKLHGSTKITYKAQEQKIRKSQEKKQRLPNNPNCYTMIWTGGQNWSLEFPDRIQWCLFRDMYEECYNRNFRAASVKDHPTPAVCLLSEENSGTVHVPFVLPPNYIKAAEDELSRTLSRNNIYDMDSDDEEWLCQFNNNAAHDWGGGCNKVSEDTFERAISSLEKAAFFQPHSLTVGDAIQACSGLVPVEVMASIHSHWLEKREKKKDLYWYGSRGSVGIKALVPQFEMKGKESLPQTKRRGKIFRGKSFTGQHNVRYIGKHNVRNQEVEMQNKLQQRQQANRVSFGNGWSSHAFELQQQRVNGVSFGNGCSSHALERQQQEVNGVPSGIECSSRELVLVSDEEARVQEAKRAACNAEEIAAAKRARSQRLLQKVDLAIFKARKAFRIAETKETIKEARLSYFSGSILSPYLSTDGKVNENVSTREGSIGSPSWAVPTCGH